MQTIELRRITIQGFKSIRNLENFEARPLNVFIGANRAGKSNFLSFFRMVASMLRGQGNLQFFVGHQGGSSEILFDGPQITDHLKCELEIKTPDGLGEYKFQLAPAAGDTFIFQEESLSLWNGKGEASRQSFDLGTGQREAGWIVETRGGKLSATLRRILQEVVVFQFHNTAPDSPLRSKCETENGWLLQENGRNLPAVLFHLRKNNPGHYHKIIRLLQMVLPFFDDFELNDEHGFILLRWREQGSQKVFLSAHASDGMLRVIALVTLLCLPENQLPGVLFLDEPELGLHPSAIEVICSLIYMVSQYRQIFIATQSPELMNHFEPEDIVVVDLVDRATEFKRLSGKGLENWLDEYTLAELWDKNVFGGTP